MGADERDWYWDRATKAPKDQYYDPKEFRGSKEVRPSKASASWLRFLVAVTLPWMLLIAGATILQIAHGSKIQDAFTAARQWIGAGFEQHPQLFGVAFAVFLMHLFVPRIMRTFYVWVAVGYLCFVIFDHFGNAARKPSQTPTADSMQRVVRMAVQRNPSGRYETPGSINGHPVSFIVDTGTEITSVSGSMARVLGVASCRPQRFNTLAGDIDGCVATVSEVSFGQFRVLDAEIAIMPNMTGPALLGMNILQMVTIEQKGTELWLTADDGFDGDEAAQAPSARKR